MVTKNVPILWYAKICDAIIHDPPSAVVEQAATSGENSSRQVIQLWLHKLT